MCLELIIKLLDKVRLLRKCSNCDYFIFIEDKKSICLLFIRYFCDSYFHTIYKSEVTVKKRVLKSHCRLWEKADSVLSNIQHYRILRLAIIFNCNTFSKMFCKMRYFVNVYRSIT